MLNGEKIRFLRQAKNLSLRQLSKLTYREVSPSYLSEIENGKAHNPGKHVSRALAKALGVKELELFSFDDYVEGEFKMCKYRREFPTMNGWVYYCDLVASGQVLTAQQLAEIGCTKADRAKCRQMMEFTCGMGIVPEPKED